MATEIVVGDSFRLNVDDVDGRPASVALPVNCLRSLLMILPGWTKENLARLESAANGFTGALPAHSSIASNMAAT